MCVTRGCRVCSVLQCVAVQCATVCCSVLQFVAVCCRVLQCVAVSCSVLQCVAVCCSVLQCVAVCELRCACRAGAACTQLMTCVACERMVGMEMQAVSR